MSREDDIKRRKALESGRGTKSNRKRVAENMTEDWLIKRMDVIRAMDIPEDEKKKRLKNNDRWYNEIYKRNREM